MKLTLAYSPCPNDTFMFSNVAMGACSLEGHEIEICLHDVETLNRLALEGAFDVTKVSFATYLKLRESYELLDVGAALGFGCGPLVVARGDVSSEDLADCRVAVPGELTTAHVLLQLWAPHARNKTFVRYDRVIPMVAEGEADCGVVIHEGRFVFEKSGLHSLVDLGRWWEEETGLPIPLGGIVGRKRLGERVLRGFEEMLRGAIAHSLAEPEGTRQYVRRHAQEMAPDVLEDHIELFVNDYSLGLGDEGRAAVVELERRAVAAGVM